MLIAAGSDTPLIVLWLASPLVIVLLLLPFLRGCSERPERLRASLLYGALGFFAANVGMAVASANADPHDWFAKYGGECWPLAVICGAALGAALGGWLRK
jgi:H+/Cl- antiporter ClcA